MIYLIQVHETSSAAALIYLVELQMLPASMHSPRFPSIVKEKGFWFHEQTYFYSELLDSETWSFIQECLLHHLRPDHQKYPPQAHLPLTIILRSRTT